MGYFRLFRRIKIAPGVTINVSKSGLSTSFGPRGAKITVGKRGVRKTVGIPGTGMYYTSLSSSSPKPLAPVAAKVAAAPESGARTGWSRRKWVTVLVGVVILAAAVGSYLGGNTSNPVPTVPPVALGLLGQASPFRSTPEPTSSAAASSPTNVPATKLPSATPKPAPTPKAKPTATPATTNLSVRVTARTASVTRNSTASVSIKTSAKAQCSIEVDYKSGPSTAAGLVDKTASSTGAVSWSWKVGGNTARGTWPIHVGCELGSRSGSVDTSFTVQ